jgi:glycosyltransferase involved in cell wall biosynthesis
MIPEGTAAGRRPGPERIALFFTLGNSLEVWDQYGILERETALYHRLAEKGVDTTFITYGRRERRYLERLPDIDVRFNSYGLPSRLYERLLPYLHRRSLRECGIFKTNQANGAQVALRAARLLHKPLVVRCGYMWSDFAARYHGADSRDARDARAIEDKVFPAATRIVVTTDEMQREIVERIPGAAQKISVIPNYVDTERFKPDHAARRKCHVVFVGRLAEQKNVRSLLKAVDGLDATITVVGSGEQERQLKEEFNTMNGRLDWKGSVSHTAMPAILNEAAVFVLPSFFEGHPKALLEAMACGVAVLGADNPGIREVIEHGSTGYLCHTSPESIGAALADLLENPELCARLGAGARRFVEDHFSLERVVESELRVLGSALAPRGA